jgi:hypothetical protein
LITGNNLVFWDSGLGGQNFVAIVQQQLKAG